MKITTMVTMIMMITTTMMVTIVIFLFNANYFPLQLLLCLLKKTCSKDP